MIFKYLFYLRLGILVGDYIYFDLTGYYIGVVGFFILSSYLLTYRMLNQLNASAKCLTEIQLIISKYFIRRIFRIYFPFVIMVSLVKFVSPKFGGTYVFDTSWFSIVTLQSAGFTHLWTIAPEIKYYFFIPLFSYATHLMSRVWYVWDILLLISIYSIENYKLFSYFNGMVNFNLDRGYLFLTRFTVFYLGSLIAVFYFRLKSSYLFKYTENNLIKHILGIVSMVFYLGGMIIWSPFYNKQLNFDGHTFKAALYWSFVLVLMLLGAPNFFTDIFNCRYLKYGGKFSFGIYLFHPAALLYIRAYIKDKNYYKGNYELLIYAIIASYFLGFLFYYLMENPLMKLGHYVCNRISSLNYFKPLSQIQNF